MCKIGVVAPCELGKNKGIVFDWDPDAKEGLCVCEIGVCAVDTCNRVIATHHQGDSQSPYAHFATNSDYIVRQADIRMISLIL